MSTPEDSISDDIDRVGWSCIKIQDVQPPFAYTVGLMRSYDHPEMIIFGLPEDDFAILTDLVEAVRSGSRIDEPRQYNLLDGFPIAIKPVHQTQHELYLGCAMEYMRHIGRIGELDAVQVFFPDIHGRFPYEPNCSQVVCELQPYLGIPLSPEELDEWRNQW